MKMTEEQKKAFGEKMKAARAAKRLDSNLVNVAETMAVEEVKEEITEVVDEKSKKIVLRFSKPVELFINGRAYLGTEIECNDMITASELVRMAKEAYGWEILS